MADGAGSSPHYYLLKGDLEGRDGGEVRRSVLLLTMVGAMVLAFSGVVLAQQTEDGGAQRPAENRAGPEDFAPGEVLVKFEPGASGQAIAEAHRQNGGQVKETIPGIGVQVVGVARAQEKTAVARYQQNPNVRYAELNGVYEAVGSVPNDPKVGNQWAFNNTGQTVGTADADIDAYEAWNGGSTTDWKAGTTGIGSAVPIAVLDTGIFGDHEDLSGKVKRSTNFTSSSTEGDVKGHGTHVAGSVAALTDNGIGGGGGTCPGCVLYNVKVLGDDGSGNTSWIANGVTWSSDNGAKVINMSLGGSGYSDTLRDAVLYAWGKGVVVVAAAGNNGSSDKFYPAAYENAIAVGATDSTDQKAGYSNYGFWVDVAAPGSNILSTVIDNPSTTDVVEKYARWNGTSMATPHVAGVAGLVWSSDSKSGACADNLCVRTKIESSAQDRTVLSGTGPDWSKARINACGAVCDTTAPTVSGIDPTDQATGVAASTNVTATFSEDVQSVSGDTFTLAAEGSSTKVAATVTYDAATKKATLDPSADLEAGKKYTATVTTGVKDKAGNALAADKTWSFTTASPTATNPDTTAPTVSSAAPGDGATGVARNTNVSATFSEAIDSATLTSSTFTLVKDGTTTAISSTRTLSSDGKEATLNPYGSSTTILARCTRFKATVTTGVKDLAGNPLAANKVWYFKTKC